jgi:site-specific recombinase XerD
MTEHLTPSEIQAVVKAAKVRSMRDWAMVLLAYRHGLRASEVCGLKLSDVDIRNESITLRRLKGSLKTVQPLYRHRGQPLLDEIHAMKAWLRERGDDGSDYVFTSQKGGRLDRTQFFRIFQALATEAGLPTEKWHPHCLKHSLGTHLVQRNTNLALVKQALGHKSISSTLRYTAVTDSQAAKAVSAALSDLF